MYSNGVKDNFDVVFMVDEINYTDEELSAICEKIYDVSKAVFNASANVTVRVYGLNGKNKQTGCDFYGRTDNVNGLESILKKVSHTELSADDLVDISRATSISEAIDYVALSYIISNIDDDQFKDNFNFEMNFSKAVKKASELGIAFDHEEFGFIFFDADRTNCNINGFETLFSIGSNSYNIKQSIVSNVAGIENKDEYKYSYARVLFDETEGMNFDIAANREVFVENVLNYIYGKVPTEAGAYDAIIATGYSTVVLDKPLTEHDMELAEKRFDDPEYVFSDEEVKSCADTDRDGLFDFEEVMFFTEISGKYQLITFKNNEIQLPKVYKILNELDEVSYVQSGSLKAQAQYKDCYDEFLGYLVLPIKSDPTNVYSDMDAYSDYYEVIIYKSNPLKESYVISSDVYENLVVNASDINYAYMYEKYPGSWMELLENAQLLLYMNTETTGSLYKKQLADYIIEFQKMKKENYEVDYLIELGKEIAASINSNLGFLLDEVDEKDSLTRFELETLRKNIDEIILRIYELELQKDSNDLSINKKATIKKETENLKEIVNELKENKKLLRNNLQIDINFRNIVGDTIEWIGFSINLYEIGYKSWNMLNEYAELRANCMSMEDCLYALRELSSNILYDYFSLKDAAAKMEKIILEEYNSGYQMVKEVIGLGKNVLSEEKLYLLCSKLYGSKVFIIQFSVGIIDNIYGFSENTKAMINNQANAGMTHSFIFIHYDECNLYGNKKTSSKFLCKKGDYYIAEENIDRVKSTFESIIISHIIGEKQFIEGFNAVPGNKLFVKEDMSRCEQFVDYLESVLSAGGII